MLGELSAVARSSRCLPVAAPHSTLGRLSAACGRPGEPAEWPLWLRWAFSGGRRALDGNPTAAAAATSCCCKAVVLIKTWPGAVSHQGCQGPSFQAAQSCGDRGPSLCQVDEPRDCIHHPDMVPKSRTKAKMAWNSSAGVAFMPLVGFLWRATSSGWKSDGNSSGNKLLLLSCCC